MSLTSAPSGEYSPERFPRSSSDWMRMAYMLSVAIVLIATVAVVASGFIMPLGYDEAYNLQVPSNLATEGSYATDGSLYGADNTRVHDSLISTGPTLLAPIGLLFAMFGEHLWLARCVASCALIALVLLMSRLGFALGGRWAGVAAAAGVLTVDTRADVPDGVGWPNWIVLGGGDILGENLAAALLASAALFLPRNRRLAGILLGLAILTKVIAALAVAGFVLALMVQTRPSIRRGLDAALGLIVWSATPMITWQALKLATLGWPELQQRWQEFLFSFLYRGTGLSGRDVENASHFQVLSLAWFLPGVFYTVLLAVMSALIVWRVRGLALSPPKSNEAAFLSALALLGTCSAWLLWYLMMAEESWVRHAAPGLLLGTPVMGAWAVAILRNQVRQSSLPWQAAGAWLQASIIGCVLAQSLVHAATTFQVPAESLAEQDAVADVVRRSDVERTVHVGWWQNPEISFLSGKPSRLFENTDGGLLVVSPQAKRHPPVYRFALDLCRKVVYVSEGYVVCWANRPAE